MTRRPRPSQPTEVDPPQDDDYAPAKDGRARIDPKQDERALYARVWAVLERDAATKLMLFRQQDRLVTIERDRGMSVLRQVSLGRFRALVSRSIQWVARKQAARGYSYSYQPPPSAVIPTLFGSVPSSMPELELLTTVPVFDPAGVLIETPGYHPSCRVYYEHEVDMPPIPVEPTDEDLGRAQDLLFGQLMADFPFAAEHDRANALAALVTPIVRPMIDGPTPAFLFSAPVARTGKSLLAEMFQTIVHGESYASVLPSRDEEREKTIAAILRCHPGRIVLLDNVAGTIDSPALAAAITSARFESRTLGHTEMVSSVNRSTWYITASNASLSSELAKRSVEIRLDAGSPRPEDRSKWTIPDLRRWVRQHRGKLVWALVVIVRRWQRLGEKPASVRLGGFGAWADTVGGIVASVGLSVRPEATRSEEDDPWQPIIEAWWDDHGVRSLTTGEVLALVLRHDLGLPGLDRASEQGRKVIVGRRLAEVKDRVWVLESGILVSVVAPTKTHGAKLWSLVSRT